MNKTILLFASLLITSAHAQVSTVNQDTSSTESFTLRLKGGYSSWKNLNEVNTMPVYGLDFTIPATHNIAIMASAQYSAGENSKGTTLNSNKIPVTAFTYNTKVVNLSAGPLYQFRKSSNVVPYAGLLIGVLNVTNSVKTPGIIAGAGSSQVDITNESTGTDTKFIATPTLGFDVELSRSVTTGIGFQYSTAFGGGPSSTAGLAHFGFIL